MLTIIIPTLQKRLDILENLIITLNRDTVVEEIIVINNAIKPLEFSYEKLKVITPDENIYVNPAWNLGVKEAKGEYVGLLNDDIIISEGFCSRLFENLPENFGVIGYTKDSIIPVEKGEQVPGTSEIKFEKTEFIDFGFGIAMFFKKENYPIIPFDIKIMYGDCWIFDEYKKLGYTNYVIEGQKIFHLGSLSSSSKTLNPIILADKKAYNKIVCPWFKRIFSIQEYADCVKLRILGLNIRVLNKK